jgi:hypothetical protein
MTNRKTENYGDFVICEAGTLEGLRAEGARQAQSEYIAAHPDIDPIDYRLRFFFPLMAVVSPVLTYEGYTDLRYNDFQALLAIAAKLNPEFVEAQVLNNLLEDAEKKRLNQIGGSQGSEKTQQQGRRHSRKKSTLIAAK